MKYKIHYIYIFIYIFIEFFPINSQAKTIPWKVSHREAEILASEAYSNSRRQVDSFYDIKDWPTSPPFYLLTIGDTGTFSINPWTGDVWNSWSCKKIHTSTLQVSQAKIKKRFSLKELPSYHQLSDMQPGFMGYCDETDSP